MEKVRPWCGRPSDRGRLKNRTELQRHVLHNRAIFLVVAHAVAQISQKYVCVRSVSVCVCV